MNATSAGPDLTIVIPAFNEAENIPPVLRNTLAKLAEESGKPEGPRCEIILVDDGSSDGTLAAAQAVAVEHENLRILQNEKNMGFGGALRTGFLAAKGRYTSFIPADGEIDIEQALGLYSLRTGVDLVVSRREAAAADYVEQVRPWYREVLTWGLSLVVRTLLGFEPRDKEGIFLINTKLLQSLPLRSDTGLLHSEILMECFARDCGFATGTMYYKPRLSGQSKVANLATVTRYFWEMFKLRRDLLFSRTGAAARRKADSSGVHDQRV